MSSKKAIIGIGVAVAVAIIAVAALQSNAFMPSLSQLADTAPQNTTAPDTVSNKELTAVKSVKEEYTYTTRASLLSDTFILQPGTERTVEFTTAPTLTAQLVGNATVQGGSVTIKHLNSEGQCVGVAGCAQITIHAQDRPGSFYNSETGVKDIDFKVYPGVEQQLLFIASDSSASTITFSFDVVYTEKGTRTPNDSMSVDKKPKDSLFDFKDNP